MGMHFVDILVVALIGLALFGPKALQSVARNAGKGMGQAKDIKDKLMAELPMEEVSQLRSNIPQVPLNSRDAVRMLVTPEKTAPATDKGQDKQPVNTDAE